MKILISGGSASGKSEFAENLAVSLSEPENSNLIYIATMKPYGDEAKERIQKHQLQRKTKGFATIECYNELEKIVVMKDSIVLLECLSNLMANELFTEDRGEDINENGYDLVVRGIASIEKQTKHLIIVSNDIFSDGIKYDKDTMRYQKKLGRINRELASKFDEVIEVSNGIPIYHKQKA